MAAVFVTTLNNINKTTALRYLLPSGFWREIRLNHLRIWGFQPIMLASTCGPPLCLHTETAGCPGRPVFFTFNASLPQVSAGSRCAEGYYSEFLQSSLGRGARPRRSRVAAAWEDSKPRETLLGGEILGNASEFEQDPVLKYWKIGKKYVSLSYMVPK